MEGVGGREGQKRGAETHDSRSLTGGPVIGIGILAICIVVKAALENALVILSQICGQEGDAESNCTAFEGG